MKTSLRYWWLFLLTGIILFISGLAVLRYPVSAYIAVAFALGIVVVIVGLVLVQYPDITMAVLPFLVSIWFLVRGISLIIYAFTFKRLAVARWKWFLAGGILIAAFAGFIKYYPFFGFLTIVIWTAAALMITGISNVLLAFRFRAERGESPAVIL